MGNAVVRTAMLASHFASRARAARQHLYRLAHSQATTSRQTEESPQLWSSSPVNASPDVSSGPERTTVVRDRRSAAKVVAKLMSLPEDVLVAWDTETTDVNPAKESPVRRGSVICATAFAGDGVDFGNGPRLFVDCLDGEGGHGILQVFRGYFENKKCQKVWHNYAFDRHMLANHGIFSSGFGGDTMHMARLVDSSRQRYSLQELCRSYLDEGIEDKRSMAERFGYKESEKRIKLIIPPTVDLQRSVKYRDEWVDYASADAELTYRLCNTLKARLQNMSIHGTNSMPQLVDRFDNLYDLYRSVLLPFGELLTDVERVGFKVDVGWLQNAQLKADRDRLALEGKFRAWAQKRSPDARYMNINSDLQKQLFFFAPFKNKKTQAMLPKEKSFCVEPREFLPHKYVAEIEEEQRSQGLEQESASGKRRKLKKEIVLKGMKKPVSETTANGWPSVSGMALRKLAGNPRADPPVYGDESDHEMCLAIDDMIAASQISTLISTFIVPLQSWPGHDGRIHASLNLNTETGRISSRRPNLQNQPALEKDRYRVRQAFVPEEGRTLIVADYGQLELRLLAHITNCKSMIDAFSAGGDFHSRTALTMFDNVALAVERRECLLEREEGTCSDTTPLLKDMFSAERRKAKTLNFSIAYGKTVVGLAKDWNVSVDEARETLRLWYRDRQEVLEWQKQCKTFVHENQFVETILGRPRHLPSILKYWDVRSKRHAERAAINAPLQGSAADLVMAAMVKLHQNRVLAALGWKIILQVHDEIILEGPDEFAEIALPIVVEEMKNPVDVPLRVDLTVDAKCAKSWYDAK